MFRSARLITACCVAWFVLMGLGRSGAQQDSDSPPITAANASQVIEQGIIENPNGIHYSSIAISPDGSLIAGGDEEGNIYVWNAADLSPVSTITVSALVQDLAFNADGTGIACTYWNWQDETGNTVLIDPLTGDEIFRLDYPTRVSALSFSPDGTQILTASNDYSGTGNQLLLWDAATGAALGEFDEFLGWGYTDAVFSPDRRYIASVGSNTLQVWDDETEVMSRFDYESPILDGTAPLPGGWSGASLVVDSSTGGDVWTIISLTVSLSRDEVEFAYLQSYGIENVVDDRVDIEDGQFRVPFTGLGQRASFDCDFLTQTEAICTLVSGDIRIDTDVTHSAPSFWSLAFSPDSSQIALPNEDGTIQVWDVAVGTIGHILGESYTSGGVSSVVYGIDGSVLVSIGGDGKLKFWDTAADSLIAELEGHEVGSRLAISSDGTLIVSAGHSFAGGNVRLWGVSTQ